jgi:cell filamentation protein
MVDTTSRAEAQSEPDSNEQVLRNRLGIKSRKEMDDTEARALERAMVGLVGKYDERHRFMAADVCEIHKSWLGAIYEWPANIGR